MKKYNRWSYNGSYVFKFKTMDKTFGFASKKEATEAAIEQINGYIKKIEKSIFIMKRIVNDYTFNIIPDLKKNLK